jgi:hypothetical protein
VPGNHLGEVDLGWPLRQDRDDAPAVDEWPTSEGPPALGGGGWVKTPAADDLRDALEEQHDWCAQAAVARAYSMTMSCAERGTGPVQEVVSEALRI